MLFKEIIGQEHLKKHLTTTANKGRIPHAQLFVAPNGSGALPLAVAYAQYILCANTGNENEGNESCNIKFKKLAHPDLHFAFPVASSSTKMRHPVSDIFLQNWREFLETNPYGNLLDWYKLSGIEKKQGQISVYEAELIVKKMFLKPFESNYKVMIIWMAEKMNDAASNKLLKLIEEPPKNTIFLLIAENEDQIINTILSRCQVIRLNAISEKDIKESLIANFDIDENEAYKIAVQSNGNYNKALKLIHENSHNDEFEQWFIQWIRAAFRAKGNAAVMQELIGWSETIASIGRENQKSFLGYCLEFFRQAMLINFKSEQLVYLTTTTPKFSIEKFAPFVNNTNILPIYHEINEAIYHIERNGNAKIILLDLSIKLTRLLHQKADKV